MACEYKYRPPGQTQEIWVTEEELKMFFDGVPPTINWWEESGFKDRNPNFNVQAYLNNVNKFGPNDGVLSPHLAPTYTEEELKSVNFTLKVIAALEKSPRNKYPSSQVAGFYNDLRKYGAPENQITLLKEYIAAHNIKEIDKEALISELAASISYTVEINTAKNSGSYDVEYKPFKGKDSWTIVDAFTRMPLSSYKTEEEANQALLNKLNTPSQEYARMVVPGGTNYTENEIATPAIVPSIKGHAQFATDNGIGWFRSDEKAVVETPETVEDELDLWTTKKVGDKVIVPTNKPTKTRRILEVQSDLFQKGRGSNRLSEVNQSLKAEGISKEEAIKLAEPSNQFLQLLNKDNNWVTFFIKSIIQDSAKKGYEKVLFPVGDTANKIEGQETLSGFIKLKEDRLKSLASKWWTINKQGAGLASYENKEDAEKYSKTNADYRVISGDKLAANRNEIAILEREIENAKTNKTAFAAISTFYETAIFNILKKQGYNPTRITDEYGNGWYEVTITNKAFQSVFLQKEGITQSKASPKTIKKVKEWLHRLGVEIQTLQPEGGINGAASMLNNLIQLAEGKEDVAITEETMHFAVDIIELTNPELFKEMMNKIGKYNIYTSVKQLYSLDSKYQNTDGGPNIVKLKKEAIGKLLSEMYINSEEGQTEHPELLQQAKTWWERILAFFGVLNKKAGFNPFQEAVESFDDLAKEGAPVKILAQKIIDNFTEKPAKDGKQHFKNALIDTFKAGDYQAVVKYFYEQLHAPTNQDVTTSTKTGVNEVFEQSPELANIGTQEQYSQYLDTIFPDSKIKDIVYHGSNIDFTKQSFSRDWIGNFKGVYFYFKNSGLFGKQGYKFDNPSLINIVKPETSYDKLQELISNNEKFAKTLWNLETNAAQSKTGKVYHGSYLMIESIDGTKSNIKYYERVNDNWVEINNETAENLIAKNSINGDGIVIDNNQAVVFEPEQIHILGSKQDIEGFKVWAKIKTAPYDIALKQLGGNEELARQIIALGSPYYQLTSEQKALQKEISSRFDKKLVDFQVEKITGKAEFDEQDDTNFYQRAKDGKVGKVSKRVTDFVKESKRPEVLARFEDATPIQKNTYKQKASFGSQFHADAENIIDASTDADGYLKPFNEIDLSSIPTNMHPAAFKALSQYLIGYMEEGEYIPGILQTQFPEGTLFRTETIVYDERKNRDVAGTIDLFGITPNGQIMIYDWKTKFLNTDIYSDIPFFSQQDYKIQLSQYKRILESYNLKDTDKEKAVIVAQAMPIIFKGRVDKKTGDVELSAITFPEVDIKQETKRYLLPVAIDEQSSGNIKVDEYIKALEKLHQTLYKQKDLNKVLKIEQLNAISGAIRELQVKQEFGPLAEQGLLFLKGAERLMLDINTQLKDGGKYIDVDKTKLEEYRGRIKNVVDNIHKYQSTYALFIDIYGKDGLTEKQEDTLKSLERLALDSSVLGKDIEAEYRQFIAHYYANKEGINLLKTEKPIKGVINRSIQSLSRMQNVALQYLRTVTSRANFEKQKNAISKQEEFEALLKPFEQLASSKGLSKKDAFILIAGKNKLGKPMNQLMNRIKTEFYTEFKKAISSEQPDVDWIKENINLEKWQEAKDKDIESFNKQVDDSIYVIGDPEQDNIEKTRKKAEYKQRMDISKPSSPGWKREDLKFYIKDEDKWETDEYKAMSADKAALDLYNFIIALNREAKDVGYHDGNYKFSTRFLPWLRASTLDRIKNSGLSAIGDSIKSIYTLTPEEEISYARVDPNTGQIEKRIPAFFTKNFAEEIRDKDGNLEGYDLSDVSTDIGETISMYIEAMYEYKSLSDIEGAVQSVRDIEAGKKAYLLDSKGRIVVEKGTGKLEKDVDNKANVALYDSFVDAILYKQQYSGDSNLSTGVTKMIEKANQYFRLKVFGLNVFTPMTTFIGGNLQGLINSRKLYKGREFLKNEMKIIGNLWGKEGNIEKGLMDYFLPFTENRARLKAERMSLDKIQRFSFSDLVMSPIRKTDVLVQMATSLSILNNTIVIDGQLINAREYVLNSPEFRDRYKNNTAKSLEKTYEERVRTLINQKGVMKLAKFNEKGLLEIEGVDRDSETTNKLRLKILNEIRTITGNLSEENKIDADRNILLKSVMMFKRWIPPLATNRFGGLQKNVDTNQYEMGRTRMVWNILFDGDGHWFKGIPQGIKTLRDMVAGNSEGIAALEKYYIRTAQTYKERTGNDLEMSPEEFYDMTRRAITQQAKEIGVLLTLLSGFMALKGAGVPDDDETKNFYRVSVRMLDKLTDEISFYYNPLSLQQITTGSWMPSLGLLTDGIKFTNSFRREANAIIFGNEQQAENAHPTKDFFSMIPIANQFFKTFVPLIDAETAKDLGISISTESRRQ